MAEHFVKCIQADPTFQINYQHPLGKTVLLINHMLREQQYYAHVTMYQAQINPEKIQENFKNFRYAFWPHLVRYEKRQEKEAKKRLLKEVAKGDIGFRPQIMNKKTLRKVNQEIAMGKVDKYLPKPRERK